MSGLPRMEIFQFLKSEGFVSFQKSSSNQITHYWSTFQLLVWFCKMNLKNLKCESTTGYILYREPFSFSLRNFCFCVSHQKMNYTRTKSNSKSKSSKRTQDLDQKHQNILKIGHWCAPGQHFPHL